MPCLRCGKPNGGGGFCDEHKHLSIKRTRRPGRGSATQRGYDAAWQRLRALVLAEDDVCYWCGKHATTVDHLIPHSLAPELRLERSNLVPACHACNSGRKITQRRDAG